MSGPGWHFDVQWMNKWMNWLTNEVGHWKLLWDTSRIAQGRPVRVTDKNSNIDLSLSLSLSCGVDLWPFEVKIISARGPHCVCIWLKSFPSGHAARKHAPTFPRSVRERVRTDPVADTITRQSVESIVQPPVLKVLAVACISQPDGVTFSGCFFAHRFIAAAAWLLRCRTSTSSRCLDSRVYRSARFRHWQPLFRSLLLISVVFGSLRCRLFSSRDDQLFKFRSTRYQC